MYIVWINMAICLYVKVGQNTFFAIQINGFIITMTSPITNLLLNQNHHITNMYIVFDTETNGLPPRVASKIDVNVWPRM